MRQSFIWEYYQNEQTAVFFGARARLGYLAKKILPGSKVLNVGIGAALFEQIGRNSGLEVFSVDPDRKAVETVQRQMEADDRAKVGVTANQGLFGHGSAIVVKR